MESFDLLIIGGGINGTAIARDASIRGATVLLVEKDDLAQHTSSASSKLIHGGLRYLEYGEFRLVREALKEREILLRTAPHIVRPLSFVLPHAGGTRPWWMVRAGLLLYRLLAWGSSLPSVARGDYRAPLKPEMRDRVALYSDALVDDSRLVVLNAVDAAERGAEIATRTELLSAERVGDVWHAQLSGQRTVSAKAIVNAAGPWVADVLGGRLSEDSRSRARLIKGSHIVVPAMWEGEQAYILQQPDGRVVFAIPYEGQFTLIGTTEVPVSSPDEATITAQESDYLCAAANRYFERQLTPGEIVWSYSGVRSLYDDGETDPKAVTRDYRLELDDDPGAALLSVFGGKITTARALAAEALDRLGIEGRKSTGWSALPGGDIYPAFNDYLISLSEWMPQPLVGRLARSYGTRIKQVVGDALLLKTLGRHFGAGLYEAEVRYLVRHEFARTAEDILWRRTKLGLHMSEAECKALSSYLRQVSR
ncbi:glycerol-3-phosphate dehydrogenase [Sphingosinicella humi]|uniref:Glycerol-3-phosphate dehydrogenase n=1 Tax=Allosphingosinicella humi TaxID=2068657 RepID=A0A2U2IZS0_9SPHN|nr:glycerol-3-phosphate dehydrogenase [Sphingosinicella humi]PWG01576.1 glycerol-3-phosphate dehydrogenase [Sphingosinicella humi]